MYLLFPWPEPNPTKLCLIMLNVTTTLIQLKPGISISKTWIIAFGLSNHSGVAQRSTARKPTRKKIFLICVCLITDFSFGDWYIYFEIDWLLESCCRDSNTEIVFEFQQVSFCCLWEWYLYTSTQEYEMQNIKCSKCSSLLYHSGCCCFFLFFFNDKVLRSLPWGWMGGAGGKP